MNLPENTKTITPIDQKRKNPLRKFEKPKINTKFFVARNLCGKFATYI